MTRQASLGELITALYDAASEVEDGESKTDMVVAATVDVLLRQRKQRLVAELVQPADRLPN